MVVVWLWCDGKGGGRAHHSIYSGVPGKSQTYSETLGYLGSPNFTHF